MTSLLFNWVFVSVTSRCSVFVSVLRVLGVRLETLRTSTPVPFFRSNETFVALFGVKWMLISVRRRGAKCFEANAENTEHRDETETNLEVNRLFIRFNI